MTERERSDEAAVQTPPAKDEASSSTFALAVGMQLEHFRILRPLGQGGMGQVYLARDIRLGRKVAIKLLRHRKGSFERAAAQIVHEARTTARFSHPNIVTLYEVGEYQGQPYLVLEYIRGQTLQVRMRGGMPSLPASIQFGIDIASALAEAHRHGILHLDLKPGNIVIGKDGRLRILDFGLARAVSLRTSSKGGFIGTPRYISPEQWRRQIPTEATDIWAFGVILYQLIEGKRPYQDYEMDLETLSAAVVDTEIQPTMSTSGPLASVVLRCLAKLPADRPSIREVLVTLKQQVAKTSPSDGQSDGPFRGLLAFSTEQADQFFGRDREILELVERLRTEPVLPVVGASGAGKSSLIHAGLIPRLVIQGPWVVIKMRPGTDPFKTLVTRLSRDLSVSPVQDSSRPRIERTRAEVTVEHLYEHPERLAVTLEQIAESTQAKVLLFVDQLEELYTLVNDEEVQQRFIRAITRAADDADDPVRVLFTVRDDFLYRLSTAGHDARSVLRRMMMVQVPDEDALKETLLKPMSAFGYRFEDEAMVEDMVNAVGSKPSSLPLLQFAAQTLWDRRDEAQRQLTRRAYEDMGGVAGVLVRHADGVLDGLLQDEFPVARQILLRLVTSENTRRIVGRKEALEGLGAGTERVLLRLINARLVSSVRMSADTREPALELAHESLIQTWDQLRRWIQDAQEELKFLNEVGQAAALWKRRGSKTEELWTGDALTEALRFQARMTGPVPDSVHRFLEAGRTLAQKQERQRRWSIGGAFVFLMLVAVGLFGQWRVAVEAGEKEKVQRAEADAQRAEAQREAATAALAKGDVLQARARIRTSLEAGDSQTVRGLWWQVEDQPRQWEQAVSSDTQKFRFSPDGRKVAAGMFDGSVLLFDVYTGAVRTLRGHTDQVKSVAFSPSGRRLASAGPDGVVVWSMPQGRIERRLTISKAPPTMRLGFIGEDRLVTGGYSGTLRVWNLLNGEATRTISGRGRRLAGFAASTSTLAMGVEADEVLRWNLEAATSTVVYRHPAAVLRLDLDREGRRAIFVTQDSELQVWSVDPPRPERVIPIEPVVGDIWIALSGDGGRAAVAHSRGLVQVYDVSTGRRLLSVKTGKLYGVGLNSAGDRLVAGGKTVRMWRVVDHAEPEASVSVGQPHDAAMAVAFSPDHRWLATGGQSADSTIRLWDVETGIAVQAFEQPGDIWDMDFHPEGRWLAVASSGVQLVDISDPAATRSFGKNAEQIYTVRFDARGRRLATGSTRLRIYDYPSMKRRFDVDMSPRHVASIDFSPDGRWIAAGLSSGQIYVWDTRTMTSAAVLSGHPDSYALSIDFDHAGRYLLSTGFEGTLRWWDWRAGDHRVVAQHPSRVYISDLSPDDRLIAAPGADKALRVWEVATGKNVYTRAGYVGEVNQARFSADGRRLAAVFQDGLVHLLDAKTGRLAWYTKLLSPSREEVLTHEGWWNFNTKTHRKPSSDAWQIELSQRAHRAVEVAGTSLLCMVTHEETLEVFDRVSDRRGASEAVPGFSDLWSTPDACVVAGSQGVVYRPVASGPTRRLIEGTVSALFADRLAIAAVQNDQVRVWGANGVPQKNLPTEPGVTAVMVARDEVWVGYRNGDISRIDPLHADDQTIGKFQNLPSSPVTRLRMGPGDTILAGFGNGTVGLWQRSTQKNLARVRLHGPVWALTVANDHAYAASQLGQHLRWDLSAFAKDRCDLLQEIWDKVLVVWSSGQAVVRGVPPAHVCRRKERPVNEP